MVAPPCPTFFYIVFISLLVSFSQRRGFKERRIVMTGHIDSNLHKEPNRYIPTTAAFGGVCIGTLIIFAILTGAIGSGSGILLAVTTIYEFLNTFDKEQATSDRNKS